MVWWVMSGGSKAYLSPRADYAYPVDNVKYNIVTWPPMKPYVRLSVLFFNPDIV
jgi:hypothetical protein